MLTTMDQNAHNIMSYEWMGVLYTLWISRWGSIIKMETSAPRHTQKIVWKVWVIEWKKIGTKEIICMQNPTVPATVFFFSVVRIEHFIWIYDGRRRWRCMCWGDSKRAITVEISRYCVIKRSHLSSIGLNRSHWRNVIRKLSMHMRLLEKIERQEMDIMTIEKWSNTGGGSDFGGLMGYFTPTSKWFIVSLCMYHSTISCYIYIIYAWFSCWRL